MSIVIHTSTHYYLFFLSSIEFFYILEAMTGVRDTDVQQGIEFGAECIERRNRPLVGK